MSLEFQTMSTATNNSAQWNAIVNGRLLALIASVTLITMYMLYSLTELQYIGVPPPFPIYPLTLATTSQNETRAQAKPSTSVTSLFDHDLIPANSVVDVNIGTYLDPLISREGRHRILVDPLFYVCDSNAKLTNKVTAFCFAVSDYTRFSTFYEYDSQGSSSSLSQVTAGTTHGRFSVKHKRTVLVLEASVLFSAIYNRNTTIQRLKMDMQGHELASISNFQGLLKKKNFISHIMAECFCPKGGKQIYQVDNSCEKIAKVLQEADYETKQGGCAGIAEWSDVVAYKKGLGLNFLHMRDWLGRRPE